MHAHDQTLLSKLGFADRDKKNPLHDLGCQYLGLQENRVRLASLVRPEVVTALIAGNRGGTAEQFEAALVEVGTPAFEHAVSKGSDRYRTTIGFIDVCFGLGQRRQDGLFWHGGVAVEVKIETVPASEILRQINLYREYADAVASGCGVPYRIEPGGVGWVAATKFALPQRDVEMLKGARVHHVRLGPKFDEWARQQSTGPDDHSPEF